MLKNTKKSAPLMIWFKLDEIFSILLLVCLLIIITIAVIFRYLLNSPIGWSAEISRLLYVWMIFLGAAVVAKNEGHLRVQILLNKLSSKWKKRLRILSELGTAAFWLIVAWQGILFSMQMGAEISPVLGYPMIIFHLSAPVAGTILFIYSSINLLRIIKNNMDD